ncbi:MAG TPA: glycosyltransferase, partial [Planctomycetaceae bacterium]
LTAPPLPAPASDRPDVRRTSMRVLTLSSVFPSAAHPTYGVFVKERVRAVADLPGLDVRVIAPTPYVPPVRPLRRRYVWWRFPAQELLAGLPVTRPRYLLAPKLGGFFHADLMYPVARRAADRLRPEFPFDLIDAHFAYPSGVVAARLGRRFGVPVVVTGRGEDMLRFPSLPVIGPKIREALAGGIWCIALSDEIAEAFLRNRARPDRVVRIPNGIDLTSFRPVPQREARLRVGLPAERPIILSVGNLQERKGFHLLADALPAVLERHPRALLVIVGGPAPYGDDYTGIVEERVRRHGLKDHVRLVGHRRHEELGDWYSAADVFALISSREGSPNVLLEALACGTPAVATPVGGIPDELRNPELGILLAERSAAAAAAGLTEALSRRWNRDLISSLMRPRSWESVAQKVADVFDRSLSCP